MLHKSETKLIILINSLIVLISASLIRSNSVDGYEISIYGSIPSLFWVLMILTIAFSSILAINEENNSHVLTLITSVMILTMLPLLRGYYFYGRGDALTHIGHTKSIIQTNYVSAFNFYPFTHILTAVGTLTTGIKIENMAMLITPLLAIIAGLAIASAIPRMKSIPRRTLIIPIIGVLAYSAGTTTFAPSWHGFFLMGISILPLVYVQSDIENNGNIILSVLTPAVILFHPVIGVFLLALLLCVVALELRSQAQSSTLVTTIIGSLTVVYWYSSFRTIVARVVLPLLLEDSQSQGDGGSGANQESTSTFEEYLDIIVNHSPRIFDIMSTFVARFGAYIIFGLLGLTSIFRILYVRDIDDESGEYRILISFVLLFTISSLLFVLSIFQDIILGYPRFGKYIIFFSILTFSYLCGTKYNNKSIPSLIIAGASIMVVAFLIFTLYPAPVSDFTNHQTSKGELEGTNWFIEHSAEANTIYQIGLETYRYHDYHKGIELEDRSRIRKTSSPPPENLNFFKDNATGRTLTPSYVLVTKRGKLFYPKVHPKYEDEWKYSPADIENMHNDSRINKIYANSEFEAYNI